MKKEKYYIEYEGDIKNNFYQYIIFPQAFVANECFFGQLRENKFYFYKQYPMLLWGNKLWNYNQNPTHSNSYRTVLYGEIMNDHQICYRYGKRTEVYIVTLIIDAGLLFILLARFLIGCLLVGPSLPSIQEVFMLMIVALANVPLFIYPKREKDLLYAQLQKMCKADGI